MRRFALLLPLLLVSCFPELPDQRMIDNLRVVGIRSDPAVADLTVFPPTTLITVSALTVNGAEADLDGVEHTWSLDLPDDIEGLEDLAELLPEGPYGPSIEIDLEQLFAPPEGEARDDHLTGRTGGVLPLRYRAETADDDREAIKLVTFLFPAPPEEGDDDDSAEPEEPEEFEPPNTNPVIVTVAVGDGDAVEAPGPGEVMYIGAIDEDGEELIAIVEDDGDQEDLSVELYRTGGCPNLAPDDEDGAPFGPGGGFGAPAPGEEADPCDVDGGGGFGGGGGGPFSDEEITSERTFAWRPLPDTDSADSRLFILAVDSEGGQTWQELRAAPAP